MKNKVFNIIIIVLSAAIFLCFLIFSHGIGYLVEQLRNLNYIWILLAVFSMFMYWAIESIILNIFTQSIFFRQRLVDSFKITMVGQFFNSITPFASGGQPAQLYFMMKRGIKAGSASSILTMKLIVYQGVLTLYSFIAIILKFTFFKENLPNFFYISIIGFLINTGVILFLIMASVNKKVTKSILKVIFTFLNKIRLVKDVEKRLSKLEEELSNFHKNAVDMSKNLDILIKCTVLTFVQLTSYFVIPYFIYRAFNMNSAGFWNMVAAETFLNMIVSVIPLPGASGGSEGGFYLLFRLFFNPATIMPAVLLWRVITYYSCIAFGSIFAVLPVARNQ